MKRDERSMTAIACLAGAWLGVGGAFADADVSQQSLPATPDEFKVKREAVFEFAQKPVVTRTGGQITVAFESKGLCNVTVAVEDLSTSSGQAPRIVRHLASGVLGPKAPAPFQKDSRNQTVFWDGKDDQGVYVENQDAVTVRVSLGLKPQFEKTLFWSPHKRIGVNSPIIAAAPEGVYVFEGCGLDSLRLYDHEGNYLRTIYPFPADKLRDVQGLDRQKFPQDGQVLPVKLGPKHRSTLLATGLSAAMDAPMAKGSPGASAMAVQGTRIALASRGLGRLATDGTTGGFDLNGPQTHIVIERRGRPMKVLPQSAAFSPDGRWVYLTGYSFHWGHPEPHEWLPCVTRVEYGGSGKPELFAGSWKEEDARSDQQAFKVPTSVACDKQGRVFVADFMNDRIQVYAPEGKLLASVKAKHPTQIAVHPVSGEIYVGSWMVANRFVPSADHNVSATFMRLRSMNDPAVLASCPLPLNRYGPRGWSRRANLEFRLEFDFHVTPPTLWLVPGLTQEIGDYGIARDMKDLKGTGLTLLVEQAGKLAVRRDFHDNVVRNPLVVRAKPANGGGGAGPRQRLYVNPKTGMLYVGEADCGDSKAFNQLVEISPDSGKAALMDLPMATEDLAIDVNGLFHLRSDCEVARFDPSSWREVPWDYGEERASAGFGSTGARLCRLISGLAMPGTGRAPSWWHLGGMAVSPGGHLAVTCANTTKKEDRRETGENPYAKAGYQGGVSKYTPALYPGRATGWETHIWDRHGKVVRQDATPGIGVTDGIGLDRDDNLYLMVNGNRVLDGKPYFLPWAETYMKVRPGKMRAISRGAGCPVPAAGDALPKRPPDMNGVWVEGAEWLYGGVGFAGWASGASCICWNTRPALDSFARSFLPEIDHFSVAVLDTNGNLITRIGRYGNADDGEPLVNAELGTGSAELTQDRRSGNAPRSALRVFRSIGGDEVALFHAPYLATHTDRRLFIADIGNSRILSVKLGYHAEEKVALKDAEKGR